MAYLETKNMQKYSQEYFCINCDYKCFKKSLFNQHLETQKHKWKQMETNGNKTNIEFICEICGKRYANRSGLWKHKKKCINNGSVNNGSVNNGSVNNEEFFEKENFELKNLMINMVNHFNKDLEMKNELVEQLKEQSKIIHDIIPKIGNNNNNKFNINVFLNEQCKNAINMSDFIESLSIQLKDINYTKDKGLIEGISTLFLNGLKQLDTFQRPIHCTDLKREVLYIKENNTWDKELSKDKIRTVINDLAYKQRQSIKEWENNNPDWENTENGKEEYINLVKTLMQDIEINSNCENKIIKNIIKETIIDK